MRCDVKRVARGRRIRTKSSIGGRDGVEASIPQRTRSINEASASRFRERFPQRVSNSDATPRGAPARRQTPRCVPLETRDSTSSLPPAPASSNPPANAEGFPPCRPSRRSPEPVTPRAAFGRSRKRMPAHRSSRSRQARRPARAATRGGGRPCPVWTSPSWSPASAAAWR